MMKTLLLSAMCCATRAACNVSNTVPRTPLGSSEIMDAHDGNLLVMKGDDGVNSYYWYAAGYGPCIEPRGLDGCAGPRNQVCGFYNNHRCAAIVRAAG